MPCRSDYLDPTKREKELQRAAKLFVWVKVKMGQVVSKKLFEASQNCYCSADYVPHLCSAIREMSGEQLSQIVYDAHDKNSRDLADWWEEHQEADRARERRAAEKLEKRENKRAGSLDLDAIVSALEPFAEIANMYPDSEDDAHAVFVDAISENGARTTVGQHRAAREAIRLIHDHRSPQKKFWVSWYQSPNSGFTLERPWWVSGSRDSDDASSICAAVLAESEEDAKKIISESMDDGKSPEFRFCEKKPDEWSPFGARFPKADWMKWPE